MDKHIHIEGHGKTVMAAAISQLLVDKGRSDVIVVDESNISTISQQLRTTEAANVEIVKLNKALKTMKDIYVPNNVEMFQGTTRKLNKEIKLGSYKYKNKKH